MGVVLAQFAIAGAVLLFAFAGAARLEGLLWPDQEDES